jgi:hypothetical protein
MHYRHVFIPVILVLAGIYLLAVKRTTKIRGKGCDRSNSLNRSLIYFKIVRVLNYKFII